MSRIWIQYLQLLLVAIGMMASQLLLRKGMSAGQPVPMSFEGVAQVITRIVSSPMLLAGYAVGGVTTLAWLVVLSRLELSYAAPTVTAMYFTLLLVVSRVLLNEHFSLARWGGTALIVLGIMLIARDASNSGI